MVGIQQTADIKLKVTLDKSGIAEVTTLLETIGKAMNAQKAVAGMEALEQSVKDAKAALVVAKSEIKSLTDAQSEEAKASRASAAAEKTAATEKARAQAQVTRAVEQTITAYSRSGRAITQAAAQKMNIDGRLAQGAQRLAEGQKKVAAEAISGSAGILAAGSKVINQQKAEEDRLRALDAKNSQMAQNAVLDYKRVEDAIKEKAAKEKAAAAQAAAIAKEQRAAAKQWLDATMQAVRAQQDKANAQKAAAASAKILSDREKLLLQMNQQSPKFLLQNANLINTLRAAHKGDTDAINKMNTALRQQLNLLGASNKMKKGGGIAGTSVQQPRIMAFGKALSAAEQDVDALFRASFRLSIVGHSLRRFSDMLIRFGSDIMKTFEEFEFTMIRAAGALEIWKGATLDGEDGFTVLRESILSLTKDMILFPAEEVAEALYFWGSATGQVVRDQDDLAVATSALSTIMRAASMTNTDYEATIKGVYSILTQFYNGSLDKASEVTEKLFLTTQKTAAEFTDLIQSFKMVGPVAAQAGADFDQVNEAFGKLSDLGLRGSQAGRGLRQLFIQMIRPSGPASAKLSELFENNPLDAFDGKTFREVNFPEGEFIGITKLMDNLALATEHLNAADRVQAIARITTANSLPLTIALMAQQRNEMLGLATAVDKFKNADPSEFFRKNWEQLSTSWKGAKESLLRMVEAIKINLGATMADVLKPLIATFNELLEKVQDFIKIHPEIIQLVTQIGAMAAVLSAVAGAVLIVMGALIGLFAAFQLIWKATEGVRGGFVNLATSLTMLLLALIDNFEYIRSSAVQVLENLSSAFGEGTDVVKTFTEAISDIMYPAREVLGMFIRFASDIAVLISQFMAFASSVAGIGEVVGGGLSLIKVALAGIVAASIINGLASLVSGMISLRVATASGALVGSLQAVYATIRLIAQGGFINTINNIALAFRALMLALGPIGILAVVAGLVAGFIALGNEIPIIGGFINSLTENWRDLNKELDESVSSFGNVGPLIKELALSLATPDVEVAAQAARLSEAQNAINKFLTDNELEGKQGGMIKLLTPTMDKGEIASVLGNINVYVTHVLFDDALEAGFVSIRDKYVDFADTIEATQRSISKGAKDFGDEWTASHQLLVQDLLRQGKELSVSGEAYANGIRGITALFKDSFSYGASVPLMGLTYESGDIVDEALNSFYSGLPDKLTFKQLEVYTHSWNEQWNEALNDNMSVVTALHLAEGHVGAESTELNEEINKILEAQLANVDVESLRDFMLTPNVLFDNKAPMEPMGNFKQFGSSQEFLKRLDEHYAELSGELLSGNSPELDAIKTRLKSALDRINVDIILDSMPDLDNSSIALIDAAAGKEYDKMADIMMSMVTPDGDSLLKAIADGAPDLTELTALAKAVAEQGAGSQEFRDIVASMSKEAGEELGDAAKSNFVEGLTNALNAELTAKELKKLGKMGTTVEQIAKLFKNNGKLRKAAFGKNQSRQSRQAYMGYVRSEIKAATDAFKNIPNLVGRKKGATAFVKALLPDFGKMSDQEKNAAIKGIGKAFKIAPNSVRAIIKKNLPKIDSKFIMDAIMPPEIDNPLLGKSPAEEAIKAGNFKEKSNPIADMFQGLFDTASTAEGMVTAAAGFGSDVAKLVVDGIAAAGADISEMGPKTTWILEAVAKGIVDAESAGKYIEQSGETLGLANLQGLATSIKSGVDKVSGAQKAVMIVGTGMATGTVRLAAEPLGTAWGEGVVAGILAQAGAISDAMKEAAKDGAGFSPPKTGPLKHIDQWGFNVGHAWGDGVVRGAAAGSRRFAQTLTDPASASFDMTHKSKKVVTVKLEVSSPDKTVDRMKQSDIRRGALDALSVIGLEHYATVG